MRLDIARFFAMLTASIGAATFVSSVLTACADEKPKPEPTFDDRIVFGMSASLSGGNETVGRALASGTQTAEVLINSLGGVLGKQVHFEIKNDASDTGAVLQGVLQDLMSKDVVALMGPGSSVQCSNTADICFNRIPQISAWATSPELTTLGGGSSGSSRWFFRTIPPDDLQAKAIFKVAVTGPTKPTVLLVEAGAPGAPDASVSDAGARDAAAPDAGAANDVYCTNPYIVYDDDVIGVPGEASLETSFKSVGIEVHKVSIPTTARVSYQSEIADIVKAKPNCIILWTYPDNAAQFFNDLHQARSGTDPFGGDLFIIGNDGVRADSVLEKTKNPDGTTNADGVHGCAPDPAPERRDYATFTTLYRNFVGNPAANPPANSANAFDAAILIALAVQRAGSTNGVAVRDALFSLSGAGDPIHIDDLGNGLNELRKGLEINYSGASGEVDFDPHGNVIADYVEWAVENGTFEIVDRIKAADLK